MKRSLKKESGQGLVEFAFIFPFFIFLLMGLINFGLIFFTNIVAAEAARDAARVASVASVYKTNAEITTLANDTVKENTEIIKSFLADPDNPGEISFDGDSITVTVKGRVPVIYGPLFPDTTLLEDGKVKVAGSISMKLERD